MPGPSGAEALARILEIDPDARVLLTSGFSEADTGARLALERLRGFLPKPYRPSALLRAVRKALA